MKKEEWSAVRPVFAAFATLVVLTLALPGCMVGPNYHPPVTSMPAGWAGISQESSTQPSAATIRAAEIAQWWHVFNDPQLTQLVQQAIMANLDLQVAQARLRQSRAQRGVVFGGLLPTVNGTSSYRRGGSAGGHDQNLFQAGFDAIWEIDVFGGIRRGVESADANILASEDNLRNVQVSLAAEVATDYALLRMYQQQILIAKRNLTSMRHAADITRQRLRAGFVSGLDVANADAQVATTEAIIPLQEAAAQQAMYALSVLLARPPTDLLATLSDTGTLPVPPARIPVGLPSELLRRRPDIRQAENNIHAATANIGVATADLFPKFSLTGDISWQAFDAAKWFNPVSRTWSFGPSVSWALFQGGSVISNINVQKALRDQSFLTYQQTVLSALQDVENALIAFTKEQEHYKALNDAVIANQKAFDISMQLYTQGQTDFLNVLNAERSLFVSEDALIQSQRFIVTDLIALYKALGGGWEEPAPVASQATTTSAPAVAK